MKNQPPDPFSENQRSAFWRPLAVGAGILGGLLWLGWVGLSDVSVPQVQVVRPVAVGFEK